MKFHQLILEVQSIFQTIILNEAKKLNLMPGQPRIIDFLCEHNGSSLSEISRGCYLSNPTVTGLIDRMEKNSLVERHYKEGNKKTNYIFLTPKGKEESKKINEIFSEMENKAFDGFSSEETKCFLNAFNKIKHNLEELYNEY